MTTAWLVYVLVVGTLLAVGAVVSAAASRQLGWSTRFSFAGALVGTLVLATVAPRQAALDRSAPIRVVRTGTPTSLAHEEATLVDRVRAARAMVGAEVTALSDAMQRRVPPAAARVMLIGWFGLSTALLVVFLMVNRRFATARRGWPAQSLHGTTVRVAPRIGPAVLGFLRAEIVVPKSLLARSDEEQRLILAHEREHLRTRDHLLLGGAWLCTIVFPWHPAVWYLTNRVRLAIELDCDARVLRGGASPHSYGALLIDMAARQSAVRIGALALTDGPSHLERRIRAMQWTRGRLAAARGLAMGGIGGLLVLAACEAKVPTAAEIAAMDVAGAQRSAASVGMVRTPESNTADFFVNGARVSAAQARALEARQIGSITVVKSERAQGRDTIYVTTVDRMSEELKRLKEKSGTPDPFEKIEHAAGQRRPSADSTEHMVAHVERELAASRLHESAAPERLRTRTSAGDAQLVYMIDGRKATMAEISALPTSEIHSINIYKKDGTGIDPDAANSVISIETRAKQKP